LAILRSVGVTTAGQLATNRAALEARLRLVGLLKAHFTPLGRIRSVPDSQLVGLLDNLRRTPVGAEQRILELLGGVGHQPPHKQK
jgi:hypothetical protein